MKLGFVSAILPELPFNEVMTFAANLQFACVEIMCWPIGKAERKYAGVTHIDASDFTQVHADEIKGLLTCSGVAISALGYYPNPLDPDPAASKTAIDHLQSVIRAAALLGVNNVNTFVGRDWTKSVDDNWPRFLKVWRPLIAFAEDNGIRIGIENCPMLFSRNEWPGGKNMAATPIVWRRMFNDIASSHFGLNYDPSHFVLQQMDPISPLREFKDKLFHIHAKDITVHRARLDEVGIFDLPKNWHTPRIPGYGSVNWHAFVAELAAVGYDGPVCIEVEDESFGQTLAGRQRAIKTARNVLAPFFP